MGTTSRASSASPSGGSEPSRPIGRAPTHRVLALVAGFNAFWAWAGAVGLLTGGISLGERLDERLPFDSPELGGVALALIVAVPLTILTVLAWTGHPATGLAALACGVILIGWILVQLAFLRELSFFHPLYLAIGAALAGWGEHLRRHPDT